MLIKELFSDYISDIPNSIGRGEILKLSHTENMRELSVYASYDQIQKYDYIMDFEKAMKTAININGFTLNCRYVPSLFSEKSMPDLVKMLKRTMHIINGHLDKAAYTFVREDKTVFVEINGSGYDILKKAGLEHELEKIIAEVYSERIKVVLVGQEVSYPEDDYEQRMAQVIASI
ncbi:MAG: hypothetical protein K2H23_05595, partial [Oscillospiraceae bacterium]|nr:hypothetical protein [Oscillospiraceae bacterium]